MSADALIDDVQRKRDQLDERVERHRTVLVKFCEHRRAERRSWYLDTGAIRRDLQKIANHSARRPWTAYHQLVLERARSFDLFLYRSPTATAELLGPASDELPEWRELVPDSNRLSAFRDELRTEGLNAIYDGWWNERDAKIGIQAEHDERADKRANEALAANRARLLESYRRAVLKSTGSDDLFCLDDQSAHIGRTVSWSTSSRQLKRSVPREYSRQLRAAEDSRFQNWTQANPGVTVEFPDLNRDTLHEAMGAQGSDVPTWRPKTQGNRERGPYRKMRSGDPGYSPDAVYPNGDVAELNFRGVPGMKREPLMSLEDEATLDTWQAVNSFGSIVEITEVTRNGKPFAQLSIVRASGAASREELFVEGRAIGFYVSGEKPGTKNLFAAVAEEWEAVRAEKSSGYHEPWRWWRGAALDLLAHRNAGHPREYILGSVTLARKRLRRRKRSHSLRGVPLPWPLDVVFEKRLTLSEVAASSWPGDRKDNALVKAARAFRAALKSLRKIHATS